MAIIISCLGLLGLVAFTAQRQKEIGIHKVVGATVSNIAIMLSKNYLKLVVVAILIAFPLSWWIMHEWLQGFEFRTSISAGIFIAAAITVILITPFMISFQAIKSAIANPVKALKNEEGTQAFA